MYSYPRVIIPHGVPTRQGRRGKEERHTRDGSAGTRGVPDSGTVVRSRIIGMRLVGVSQFATDTCVLQ